LEAECKSKGKTEEVLPYDSIEENSSAPPDNLLLFIPLSSMPVAERPKAMQEPVNVFMVDKIGVNITPSFKLKKWAQENGNGRLMSIHLYDDILTDVLLRDGKQALVENVGFNKLTMDLAANDDWTLFREVVALRRRAYAKTIEPLIQLPPAILIPQTDCFRAQYENTVSVGTALRNWKCPVEAEPPAVAAIIIQSGLSVFKIAGICNAHGVAAAFRRAALYEIVKTFSDHFNLRLFALYGGNRARKFGDLIATWMDSPAIEIVPIKTSVFDIHPGDAVRGNLDRRVPNCDSLADGAFMFDCYITQREALDRIQYMIHHVVPGGQVLIGVRGFFGDAGGEAWDIKIPSGTAGKMVRVRRLEAAWIRQADGLIDFAGDQTAAHYPVHEDMNWLWDGHVSGYPYEFHHLRTVGPYTIFRIEVNRSGLPYVTKPPKALTYEYAPDLSTLSLLHASYWLLYSQWSKVLPWLFPYPGGIVWTTAMGTSGADAATNVARLQQIRTAKNTAALLTLDPLFGALKGAFPAEALAIEEATRDALVWEGKARFAQQAGLHAQIHSEVHAQVTTSAAHAAATVPYSFYSKAVMIGVAGVVLYVAYKSEKARWLQGGSKGHFATLSVDWRSPLTWGPVRAVVSWLKTPVVLEELHPQVSRLDSITNWVMGILPSAAQYVHSKLNELVDNGTKLIRLLEPSGLISWSAERVESFLPVHSAEVCSGIFKVMMREMGMRVLVVAPVLEEAFKKVFPLYGPIIIACTELPVSISMIFDDTLTTELRYWGAVVAITKIPIHYALSSLSYPKAVLAHSAFNLIVLCGCAVYGLSFMEGSVASIPFFTMLSRLGTVCAIGLGALAVAGSIRLYRLCTSPARRRTRVCARETVDLKYIEDQYHESLPIDLAAVVSVDEGYFFEAVHSLALGPARRSYGKLDVYIDKEKVNVWDLQHVPVPQAGVYPVMMAYSALKRPLGGALNAIAAAKHRLMKVPGNHPEPSDADAQLVNAGIEQFWEDLYDLVSPYYDEDFLITFGKELLTEEEWIATFEQPYKVRKYEDAKDRMESGSSSQRWRMNIMCKNDEVLPEKQIEMIIDVCDVPNLCARFDHLDILTPEEETRFREEYGMTQPMSVRLKTIKPRAISVTDPQANLVCGPWMLLLSKYLKEAEPIAGVFFGSGLTGEQQDAIAAKIHAMGNGDVVCGDDVAALIDGREEDRDARMSDQSMKSGAYRFRDRLYRKGGMPADVREAVMWGSKTRARIRHRSKGVTVKVARPQQQPSGGTDTTVGTSLTMGSVCSGARLLKIPGKDIKDWFRQGGMDIKIPNTVYGTFLKQWLCMDSRGRKHYLPLPSAVLKAGATRRSPLSVCKGLRKYEQMAAALQASRGFIPIDYPILGTWLDQMGLLGVETNYVAPQHKYEAMLREEEFILDRDYVLEMIESRYGLTQAQVIDVEELIRSVSSLPCIVTHEVFTVLGRVDYDLYLNWG
jgi:hypothetical protein